MATASKVPAASTPKSTMAAAPTPSPRPMGRPFSHKSPAIKTPASLHGHSHNMSTSSHPSSTPLPAPASGEDALAFNSPAAALIASIGSQGLTPLPNGQDGLGITAKEQVMSTKEGSVGGKRNVEEERLLNVHEVQRLLKTRLAGRAICREGVQRIAQLSSLTFAWLDDNNLSIAGNCVDLEIVFDDAQRDSVNDVVLKINTSGVEEHKKDASAVLRQDLALSDFNTSAAPWKSLEAFSANLGRLAHLDQLSNGLNCFEALDGLYYSFQRIWEEEKKRLQNKHILSRICEGTLGRPMMHRKRKLGLSLDYWVENRRMKERRSKPLGHDAMDIDEADSELDQEEQSSPIWLARVGCDKGYPAIRISKDWLGQEVFAANDADKDNYGPEAQDETLKPMWLDPDATLVTSPGEKDDTDERVIEQAGEGLGSLPKPPNIRFTLELEPAVLLTNSVVDIMFAQGLSIAAADFAKATTYRQALDDLVLQQKFPQSQQGIETQRENTVQAGKRWTRSLTVYDKDGLAKQARHSYALQSSTPVEVYPMHSFSFEHPRQLAEAIPVLRQYALLWSIMRKLVPRPASCPSERPALKKELDSGQRPKKSRAPQKKSNISAQQARLDTLFGSAGILGVERDLGSSSDLNERAAFSIDISLNFTLTNPPKAKLDLIFPLPLRSKGKASGQLMDQGSFGTVSVEIGINGKIVVASATGLRDPDSEILRKMADVLSISEDLGVLVEWILGRLRPM